MVKVTEHQAKNWAKLILTKKITYGEIDDKSGGEYYFSLVNYHVRKYRLNEDGEIEEI